MLGDERAEEGIDGFGRSALVGWWRKSRERVGENLDREEIPRWKWSGGGEGQTS